MLKKSRRPNLEAVAGRADLRFDLVVQAIVADTLATRVKDSRT
jgi:hypothetical protein